MCRIGSLDFIVILREQHRRRRRVQTEILRAYTWYTGPQDDEAG